MAERRLFLVLNVHALVFSFVLISTVKAEVAAFVTPSFPVCYIATTRHENVTGSTGWCARSWGGCSHNGQRFHFYCGKDHACCYTADGCPACCTKRTTMNTAEIAGVVIASVVVVGLVLLIVYLVAGKCSSKGSHR